MKKQVLVALAAGALVAGCAHVGGGGNVRAPADPKVKCTADHPVCHVTIRVKDCRVTVEPDEKYVSARPGGVQMLWTIQDSPGVKFMRDGIRFKREPVDERGRLVFEKQQGSLAGGTFAMHNRTTPGKYPYTVYVVDNGKVCEPHDPGVVNEM